MPDLLHWERGVQIGAKIYITAICLAGGAGLSAALIHWSWPDPWRFFAYCFVTLCAAGMKVALPGINGTLSVSYIFVLAGIVDTSWEESVVIGVIANVVQMYWGANRRPKIVQVAFNISAAVVAVVSAYDVYHSPSSVSGTALKLAAAGFVYFVMSTMSVAVVVAFTEQKPLFSVWRVGYLWSLPYYIVGASLSALIVYLGRLWGWEFTLMVLPVVYLIFRSYRLYLGQLEGQKLYAEQMASLHLRTIETLALAIEAKDQTTGEHLRRVQVYAREIGAELGLTENERMALQAASILHDIGKLAVPDYIISKPGRLTPEEFEKMKIHPVVGAEILETIGFPYPVVPIVRAHHEKWDGSGYPYGLKGEEIPVGARILTCVDCFDALASDRQYRRALPLGEALDVVRSESGKSFDPRVVEVLSRRYLELEKLAGQEPVNEPRKLSTEMRVIRGAAPDAGFQAESRSIPQSEAPSSLLPKVAAARQELHALYEVMQSLGKSLSLVEMLSVLAARVRTLVPYDGIAIYLREDQTLVPQYVNGENYGLFASLRIPMGQGLSGWVAENHKPILNGNPSVEPGYLNDPTKFSVLSSGVAVPIEGSAGCLGVLALYAREKDSFSKEHLRILEAISAKMSTAIEWFSSRAVITPVTTDDLTSLPNAASLYVQLEAELARAGQAQKHLTVFVFDLDGFQRINHHRGEATGNRVLREVATVLQTKCKDEGYLGRMGGDEFVAVVPGCASLAVPARIEDFEQSVRAAGVKLELTAPLTVSIGAATFPHDGEDADSLLAAADRNMHRLKRSRRLSVSDAETGLANLARSVSAEAAPAPQTVQPSTT